MNISRNAFIKRIAGALAAIGIGAKVTGKEVIPSDITRKFLKDIRGKISLSTYGIRMTPEEKSQAVEDFWRSKRPAYKIGDTFTLNGKPFTITDSTSSTEIKPPIMK